MEVGRRVAVCSSEDLRKYSRVAKVRVIRLVTRCQSCRSIVRTSKVVGEVYSVSIVLTFKFMHELSVASTMGPTVDAISISVPRHRQQYLNGP